MPLYLEYYFWLVGISAICFIWERLKPWRKKQEVLREGFVQDLFWLVFNQQYMGWMLAIVTVKLISLCDGAFARVGLPTASDMQLIAGWPIGWQIIVAFVIKDFISWNVHRMLHLVPWMWEFHKLHHSIEELDWLAAFRGHWGEIVIHRMISFLPLVLLGTDPFAIFVGAVVSLLLHELTHSNIRLHFGPLSYIFNTPTFHSWHHDLKMHGKGGQNFGISLSLWDWLFRTAYWPNRNGQPERYGFYGMKRYPKNLLGRFLHPFVRVGDRKPSNKKSHAD